MVRALLGVSLDGCRGAAGLARWLQPVPRAVARWLVGAGGVDAAAAAEERGGGGGPARARPAAAHVALGYFASSAVEERGAAAACAAPLGLLRAGGDLGGTDGADGALPRFFHAAAASWWSGERGGAALPAWGVHRLRVIVEAGDDAHPLRHAERHAPSAIATSTSAASTGRSSRRPARAPPPRRWRSAARSAASLRAAAEARGCRRRCGAATRRGRASRSRRLRLGRRNCSSGAARQGDAADGTDFGVAGAAGARLHAACAPAAGGLDRGVAALRRRLDGDGFHRRLSSTVRVPAQLLAGLGDGGGARGCSRWALVERLPPSVLVDAWQLRRLQRLGDGALGPATEGVVDFVPDDIEAPAERSAQAVLVARGALIFDGGGALLNVSLPLHARYAAPATDGGSHRPLRLPPPLLFLRCDGGGAAADEPLLCPPAALARAIGAVADCEGGGGGGVARRARLTRPAAASSRRACPSASRRTRSPCSPSSPRWSPARCSCRRSPPPSSARRRWSWRRRGSTNFRQAVFSHLTVLPVATEALQLHREPMEALDVVHDPSSSEPSASLTTEHPGGKKPVRAIAPTQHSNQVILGFASPHHVQRTFDMRRAGPPVGEINSVVVQTLSSPKGQVTLPTDREMRVSELKTMLLHHLHLSPRKALVLRWHGSALDDAATLAESHLHDKCTIELAVRQKAKEDYTPEDYDIRQVRIRSLDGRSRSSTGCRAARW